MKQEGECGKLGRQKNLVEGEKANGQIGPRKSAGMMAEAAAGSYHLDTDSWFCGSSIAGIVFSKPIRASHTQQGVRERSSLTPKRSVVPSLSP